ncbi:MAG: 30S ribosomal protein S2 [Caldilineaceae bacterium]|nr:30S ribosomal protein S2 [Caldilineaceae bacterium]
MKELLEAGVHFGHRTRRWNPKMRPFIFTERSGIHIIDLHQTVTRINRYYELVRDTVAKGGTVLFVGTKRQAQATVEEEAERCGMPYITTRWLGGTLTNWVTIKQRIDYLNRMERRLAAGEFRGLPKKEQTDMEKELAKLNHRIGGIKTMTKLPDLIFVVDTRREDLAVLEANKLGVPVLAVVDTNCDPDPIDYIIPGNDDAIRAVKLLTKVIADAAEEGQRFKEVDMADTGKVSNRELAEMEQYLGPSTLAKLQSAEEDAEEDVEIEDVDEVAAPSADAGDASADAGESSDADEDTSDTAADTTETVDTAVAADAVVANATDKIESENE